MKAAKNETTASTAPAKKAAKKTAKASEAKTPQKSAMPARKKAATTRSTAPKKKAAAKKAVKAARKAAPEKIPDLLLEGDQSPTVVPSGPGARYDLGRPASAPTRAASGAELGELPEAYGTRQLVATARDPRWLYIFWDLTDTQQQGFNKKSRDGHLVVRLIAVAEGDRLVSETHVHPESRNWFINVPAAGARYRVELGYHNSKGKWQGISVSRVVTTPPDAVSANTSVEFATLPAELPFRQLLALVREVVAANVPLMEALEQLRAEGFERLPAPEFFKQSLRASTAAPVPTWTPEQERALAQVITMDEVRRVWLGSHEITELVRKQLVRELASQAAAAVGGVGAGARAVSSLGLSSPLGGEVPGARKGFWFNVNAELIIYGATEPDATVTIGDRQIRLRSDGTFSYRFSLPDGPFALPIQATSADGDDWRNADLTFSRDTQYRGEVGVHPQDAALRPPRPEHTA
jgi:hypothetical protein